MSGLYKARRYANLRLCHPVTQIRALRLERHHSPLPPTFFWHDPPLKQKEKEPERRNGYQPEISDMEWELRVGERELMRIIAVTMPNVVRVTGRGIDLIKSTMPHFFKDGLVLSSGMLRGTKLETDLTEDEDTIYSRAIRMTYTPPMPFPPPFPRTLTIEGLPSSAFYFSVSDHASNLGLTLYKASAAVARTSLVALYSDCTLTLRGAHVLSPTKREWKLKLNMNVAGQARLTGTPAEWDM